MSNKIFLKMLLLPVGIGSMSFGLITTQPIMTGVGAIATTVAVIRKKELSEVASLKQQIQRIEVRLASREADEKSWMYQSHTQAEQMQSIEQQNTLQDTSIKQNTNDIDILKTAKRLYVEAVQKLQFQVQEMNGRIIKLEHKETTVESPVSSEKVVQMPKYEPQTRVYIDGNNLAYALAELRLTADNKTLKSLVCQDDNSAQLNYYLGLHSTISKKQEQLLKNLKTLGYKLIPKKKVKHNDGTCKTIGDDAQIIVDMMLEVKEGDHVVLVSGDGDFIPVLKVLKAQGVRITIIAKKAMLNNELKQYADQVIYLDVLQ